MIFFINVFSLFTPQNKHARISFNTQNDQWVNAHLFVKKMKICMRPWICRYGGQASLHDPGDAATLGWGANTVRQSNTAIQSHTVIQSNTAIQSNCYTI